MQPIGSNTNLISSIQKQLTDLQKDLKSLPSALGLDDLEGTDLKDSFSNLLSGFSEDDMDMSGPISNVTSDLGELGVFGDLDPRTTRAMVAAPPMKAPEEARAVRAVEANPVPTAAPAKSISTAVSNVVSGVSALGTNPQSLESAIAELVGVVRELAQAISSSPALKVATAGGGTTAPAAGAQPAAPANGAQPPAPNATVQPVAATNNAQPSVPNAAGAPAATTGAVTAATVPAEPVVNATPNADPVEATFVNDSKNEDIPPAPAGA